MGQRPGQGQTFDDHTFALGKVIVNLLSLEVLIRLYLQGKIPLGFDLFKVVSGGHLPESPLTNYDTLGQVLDKYHKAVKSRFHVDKSVVGLRDAFAHGRLLSYDQRPPLTLFKFGKSTHSKGVPVQQVHAVDLEWLVDQRRRTSREIGKVRKAMQDRGLINGED